MSTAVADERISVIVPCRNAEPWIEETLQSVVSQRGVRLEIIVVDDGSTDGSASRVSKFGGIRLIEQAPQGVSEARNVGTRLATGSWLQYLDADDVLEPDTLSRRLNTSRSGADVVLSPFVRWQRQIDGAYVASEPVQPALGSRPELDLLTDAWWPPGAILYSRSIVERIGSWRRDLPVIQDARFLLDAALAGARFAHVQDVGLRYRIHGAGSLSRRDPRAFLVDCYRSAADLHDRWSATDVLDDGRRTALIKVFGYLSRQLFEHDRSLFREVVDRLQRLDPAFRPASPATLRAVSAVVGYPAAEHVAFWWRRLKGLSTGV